jgi:putative addiction module CopG family antidote
MRTTQQLSIILPIEMAETIRAKVADGHYASESEVIRDGLRALFAQDQAIESWLHGEVAQAYDALQRSPDSVVSPKQVRARLRALALLDKADAADNRKDKNAPK